jgi:hypothetical protein
MHDCPPEGGEAARPPQGRFILANVLAIMRLQALGLSRFWAAAIPVLIFAAINCSSRLSSLACRAVLSRHSFRVGGSLARRRVDFIGVVVPRFFS